MKKTILLFLILSLNSHAQTVPEMASGLCLQTAMGVIENSVKEFTKQKKTIDGMYNLTLGIWDIGNLANTQMGTLVSEEFDSIYVNFLTTAQNTQITDAQIQDFQKKLKTSFEKAKPDYIKSCQTLMTTELKTCNITSQIKELSPAQKICTSKSMQKLGPLMTKLAPDTLADHNAALDAEAKLDDAITKNAPEKEANALLMKRFNYSSHHESILPMALAKCVHANNQNMRKLILGLVSEPAQMKNIIAAFKNKNPLIEKSLKYDDLHYFRGLVQAGFLNAREKKTLAAKSKNPEVLKILK